MCHYRHLAGSSGTGSKLWLCSFLCLFGALFAIAADAISIHSCMLCTSGSGNVTVLGLPPAATGTSLIAADRGGRAFPLAVFHGIPAHDVGWTLFRAQKAGHDAHGLVHMLGELLVSGAQVIQPRLSIGRRSKAVLGTAAVAGKAHIAFAAVAREPRLLITSEFALLLRGDQVGHVVLADSPA